MNSKQIIKQTYQDMMKPYQGLYSQRTNIMARPYFDQFADEKTKRFVTALLDPDIFWEAIGPDGITYPFDDSRFGLSEEQRVELVSRINDFDNRRAKAMAILILEEDDAALGQMVREQITAYIHKCKIDEDI